MAARDAVQGKTIMVTEDQYRAFLHDQMSMPHPTTAGIIQIVGCDSMDKFSEMREKDWERAYDQLRKPPGTFIRAVGVRGNDNY